MKRIVLGVVAAAGIFAVVACGGGGGGESQECKDYIACYVKTGGTASTLDTTYGANGTCWSTGVAATATACTDTCKSSLATLKTSYADAGC